MIEISSLSNRKKNGTKQRSTWNIMKLKNLYARFFLLLQSHLGRDDNIFFLLHITFSS